MKINGHAIKKLRGDRRIEALALAADLSSRRIEQIEAVPAATVNKNVASAMAKFLGVPLKSIEVEEPC